MLNNSLNTLMTNLTNSLIHPWPLQDYKRHLVILSRSSWKGCVLSVIVSVCLLKMIGYIFYCHHLIFHSVSHKMHIYGDMLIFSVTNLFNCQPSDITIVTQNCARSVDLDSKFYDERTNPIYLRYNISHCSILWLSAWTGNTKFEPGSMR